MAKLKFEKYVDDTVVINMDNYNGYINFVLKKEGNFVQIIDDAFLKMTYIKQKVQELNEKYEKPKKG